MAAELGVVGHDTLDALLDATDALTIVVPTPAHYAVARAALERGKHLLIEKPITATLAQADELLELATRNGVVVQTGHVERFNRAVRAALPYVDQPRFRANTYSVPPRGTSSAALAIGPPQIGFAPP